MLHNPLWNGYLNAQGTKQDPILNMTLLELNYISIQGGIIYPYEDWFLS